MKRILWVLPGVMLNVLSYGQSIKEGFSLRNDPMFKELIEYSTGFTRQAFLNCNKKGINPEQLKQKVEQLQNEKIVSTDEMLQQLDEIMGGSSQYSFPVLYKMLVANWASIREKYGSLLTDDFIRREAEEVVQSIGSIDNDAEVPECKDKRSYTICAAAATAVAMLGHAACITTIFGIPACVALVATIQVAAINECKRNWCQ